MNYSHQEVEVLEDRKTMIESMDSDNFDTEYILREYKDKTSKFPEDS